MRAPCVLDDEVPRLLEYAHDGHGHFAGSITLDRLLGEAYWPTRVKDVKSWCRSCHTCQCTGLRLKAGRLQHVQRFEPFEMISIDFLGPINPECSQTESKYILMAIDYFLRFTWAWPYRNCGMKEVAHFMSNHIAPTFGWPKAIYSDNGSHFVGGDITNLFQLHGVTHYTAPVTHPSSVGLIE